MEAVAAAALHREMHGRVTACRSGSRCAPGKVTCDHFSRGREAPQCDSGELLQNCQLGIPAVLGVAVAASGAPVATSEELTAALFCCCWEN